LSECRGRLVADRRAIRTNGYQRIIPMVRICQEPKEQSMFYTNWCEWGGGCFCGKGDADRIVS
jgi:hypothetical protein